MMDISICTGTLQGAPRNMEATAIVVSENYLLTLSRAMKLGPGLPSTRVLEINPAVPYHIKTATHAWFNVAAPKGCDFTQLPRYLDAVME